MMKRDSIVAWVDDKEIRNINVSTSAEQTNVCFDHGVWCIRYENGWTE